MAELPTGTVTFLFTDIEGSTKLAQEYPDEIPALLARHNEILHQAIEAHNGFVFQIVGDSFCAAFHTASDALTAALDAQRCLQHEAWQLAPVKVRMGLHIAAARAGLRAGLALALRLGTLPQVVLAVTNFAELAYAEGQTERALVLSGLARRQPAWSSDHQRSLDTALAQWALDPAVVEAGLAKGAARPLRLAPMDNRRAR